MLEEMTGIHRETVRYILVENLKRKKVCARFGLRLLTLDQKHECSASSVEFVEMTDEDRNVSCMIQKQNVRVQLGQVQRN
jgi:hypothetical protein